MDLSIGSLCQRYHAVHEGLRTFIDLLHLIAYILQPRGATSGECATQAIQPLLERDRLPVSGATIGFPELSNPCLIFVFQEEQVERVSAVELVRTDAVPKKVDPGVHTFTGLIRVD